MIADILDWLFDPTGMSPHGFCLLWAPELVAMHAVSDVAIALAYFSIPLALVTFLRRRQDLVFRPVFWLFAAFILLCGTGHLIDLYTLWVPAYGLEAVVKVLTASVSVATALALWPLMPEALALPSPRQMRAANATLTRLAEERGQMVQALRESEARYRAGFLRSPMPLHTLDADGILTGVSDRWLDLTGHDRQEVVGRGFEGFVHGDDQAGYAAGWRTLMAGGELHDMELRLVRRDGEVVDVLLSARLEQPAEGRPWVLGALVDVTARRRAEAALYESEERLRQAQKMEALGQLAGGIAHDINNVLQAVTSGASLIQRRAEDPAMVRRLTRMVTEAAERGSATTHRLLAFARRDQLRAVPVDAGALLAELREILTHSLGSNIVVEVATADDVPPLLADQGQLETVLVNLATNARDAMPEGGRLRLSASAEQVKDLHHRAGLSPGHYVRLQVTDSGTGMDAATLARATEPFFTTKPVGKGTGLGLPMARGFAQQSGGALHIASRPGEGTVVTLWLPSGAWADRVVPPPGAPLRPVLRRPAAHVMLVDDEAAVREVLSAELEELGFRVSVAVDGEDALRKLEAETPDMLVSDLSMPGMDGLALIRAVANRSPELPSILLTGFAGDAASLALGAAGAPLVLLRKPVTGDELAGRIAALLRDREHA